MLTQKFKVGLSVRYYHYTHKDTFSPVYTGKTGDLGVAEIYTMGPRIGYYFFNGAFKPFIDISAGYYSFTPTFDEINGISQKEYEKKKNLSSQSGLYGDMTIGIDIRLSQTLDFRIAPHLLYAKTKPMYGSAALSAGFVYHTGNGFVETN